MTKVVDINSMKGEIGLKANRYCFISDTLTSTCFFDDKLQGYILIIDNGYNQNLFTNYATQERLTIHEIRKILNIYGFKIKEHIYNQLEKESSKAQISCKYEYDVGRIDSFEYE